MMLYFENAYWPIVCMRETSPNELVVETYKHEITYTYEGEEGLYDRKPSERLTVNFRQNTPYFRTNRVHPREVPLVDGNASWKTKIAEKPGGESHQEGDGAVITKNTSERGTGADETITLPLRMDGEGPGGVLRGIVPEAAPDLVEDALENIPRRNDSRSRMVGLCRKFERRGFIDRLVDAVPMWMAEPYDMSWGPGCESGAVVGAWQRYVRMALDGGYYGITKLDLSRNRTSPNRWAILCGWRRSSTPQQHGGSVARPELLVSSAQEQWISVYTLLRGMGAYNVILAKP